MGERLAYYSYMPEDRLETIPLIDRDPIQARLNAEVEVINFYRDHGNEEMAKEHERRLRYMEAERNFDQLRQAEKAAIQLAKSGIKKETFMDFLNQTLLPDAASESYVQLYADSSEAKRIESNHLTQSVRAEELLPELIPEMERIKGTLKKMPRYIHPNAQSKPPLPIRPLASSLK